MIKLFLNSIIAYIIKILANGIVNDMFQGFKFSFNIYLQSHKICELTSLIERLLPQLLLINLLEKIVIILYKKIIS